MERFLYSSPETDNAVEVSLLCCRSRISVEFPILCSRTSNPLHSEQSFETDNAVEVSILWAAKVSIRCFRGIWLFCEDGEVGHRRLGDNLPRLGVRPQRSVHLCSVSPNSLNCSNVVILLLIQVRSHYVHLVRDCHHPSSRDHHRICQGDPLHPSIHHPLSTIHVTLEATWNLENRFREARTRHCGWISRVSPNGTNLRKFAMIFCIGSYPLIPLCIFCPRIVFFA